MTTTPDDQPILTETRLAEIAGVKRARRVAWATAGHVRRAGRGGRYGQEDAAELAAFAELVQRLDYDDAVLAWAGVRESIAAADEDAQLLIVFDVRRKTARLALARSEIGDVIEFDGEFRVINLTTRVAEIRATYRRIRDARTAPAAA